jgi:hypothetical protein
MTRTDWLKIANAKRATAHLWTPWLNYSWPNSWITLCGKIKIVDLLRLMESDDDMKRCKACEKKLKAADHE